MTICQRKEVMVDYLMKKIIRLNIGGGYDANRGRS